MSNLHEILAYNESFVRNKEYEPYATTKFPNKKMVILSCMDTRLVELLPKSLNIQNGDVKIVKSAGAIINHPFGGIMRSLLVAVYALQAEEIFVIGHHDCGMASVDPNAMIDSMIGRGVDASTVDILTNAGVNVHEWLEGFDNVADSVQHSVDMIKNHPLLIPTIRVHGLIIDPATGKLDLVHDGTKD